MMSGTPASIRTILRIQQNNKCIYCECKLIHPKHENYKKTPKNASSIDHKIPRAKGGKSEIGNYALSCVGCNQEKGAIPFEIFYAYKRMHKILSRKRVKFICWVAEALGYNINILSEKE